MLLIAFERSHNARSAAVHPGAPFNDALTCTELFEVLDEMLGRALRVGAEEIPMEAEKGHERFAHHRGTEAQRAQRL